MFTFTISDLLNKNLAQNAERISVIFNTEEISYQELFDRVEKTAAWLHSIGISKGDRIGIHLPKSIEEIVATFAIARIGAVFVNINYQWSLHQLEYVVSNSQIRVLFTDSRRAKKIIGSDKNFKFEYIVVRGKLPEHPKTIAWDVLDAEDLTFPCPAIDVDLAALLYTSGSTGLPKGVMLTHANIVLGARSVAKYLGNSSQDRILSLPPLSFDYGLNQITSMFLVGGCVVLQATPLATEITKTVVDKAVTGVALVPPSWVQWVRYLEQQSISFPTLRYITNTGGKIPDSILKSMPKVFPDVDIYLMYGLTEAFRSTYLSPELFNSKLGAIGRAIPGSEVFVIDPDRGICGPGEQGELIHRGALISRGYWNDDEATDLKIKTNPHLSSLIGDEKVLHSGDIVRIDEDGYLWFVNRADSMIKSSGFRISPTEVEEIISRHEKVSEVIAFGVNDDELGQVVHIAVTSLSDGNSLEDDLQQFVTKIMPNYMIPRHIHILSDKMPSTASGKIDRPLVIKQCLSYLDSISLTGDD